MIAAAAHRRGWAWIANATQPFIGISMLACWMFADMLNDLGGALERLVDFGNEATLR